MASRSVCVIADELDEKRLLCTVTVSVPNESNRSTTALVDPPPMEVSATTAATPITMPRIVRKARTGWPQAREREAQRLEEDGHWPPPDGGAAPPGKPPLGKPAPPPGNPAPPPGNPPLLPCVEFEPVLSAPSVYWPVTTVSPSARPLVISVEDAVAMPVCTWR